jgi:hypothetical protein
MKRLLLVTTCLLLASAARAEGNGESEPDGYSPPPGGGAPLSVTGYVDVGFAHATGNGSSFPDQDTRFPADYGVDAFAPAVNSLGDVASSEAGRFTNHFLPFSAGIGNRPSFLLNVVSLDLRYLPTEAPLLLFTRVQALPRFSRAGDATRVRVDQAFARVSPLATQELAFSVGKFDPVFGIEYLENPSNLRTGVTPSLIARYTTGQQLGVKGFYRLQLARVWSALSLNLAATNGSPQVESLQTNELSLTGTPVGSGRLGYELDLPAVQLKLGASGMAGPRNDQRNPQVTQRMWGLDARLFVAGLSLAGEVIDLTQQTGTRNEKLTGTGEGTFATAFHVRGTYGFLGYTLPLPTFEALGHVTIYGRYDRRRALFDGFTEIVVDRFTAGLRVDLWDALALKGELLFNRELRGAPSVDNDVQTLSLVYTW